MIVFPALDRVSESVLPSDVQHPTDVAAQRIQFRFAGGPWRQVVEVADLSGQRRSGATNLSNERAERREMVLEPRPSKAARFLVGQAPQPFERLFDVRPRFQWRQPDRIEVPGCEARAVPGPRAAIQRGGEAEERASCIILHRPSRRHLVGNESRVKTVSSDSTRAATNT